MNDKITMKIPMSALGENLNSAIIRFLYDQGMFVSSTLSEVEIDVVERNYIVSLRIKNEEEGSEASGVLS